ncbi:P-loop containing nucleoside triphosphate hydrolase protein [Basidiobolus meristosporus CBS 931.73]|uniref:p-loop containing nucleoside triphosphate hydrolase protein n=1 Tax=Basidiobolus meristosporus CBS 931.73 TaxID=1314790 RepID=A0A1Y1Z9W5_9FUNG|nr:P-loop containing nucleoside triphosphate hydrolase protein [Basidiobolus meristosporus CBS 931.73]|eukprot:ORY07083.1 P-loop containing nucleoside triphosphate hydrolase protein [Basidiobolus meristosporus CBS 931.73]
MNSCGKTSLLKACGLSIILAQMGSFVPASSFEFSPYKSLMTRILSEDNILKGQSSFVAEMSDLRNILKRADPYTLVLADEITHGTEHISGSAIFASSVMTLAKQNISFMFTTHLHNIYKFIKDIPNVKVFHLSVNFEHINSKNVIIFERKIKEGPCDSIYGLEVCEFLNMDSNFLQKAFQIRADILSREDKTCPTIANGLLNQYSKYSRYNKDKLVYKCQICNYVPTQTTDLPINVHHIQHQHTSDNNAPPKVLS